ncbi:MAG: DUF308 domain-containing protein [Ginsengibacter sp.]
MIRSKNWWLITLRGLIFFFIGIYIMRSPVSGMLGLVVYGSIMLFLSGIIISAFAITTRKVNRNWTWQSLEGLLDIIIAIILLSNIGLTPITLPYVFAFFGVLTGIFWIMESLYFRRSGYRYWTVALIAGLFSIAVGLIIFYQPVLAALTIITIIGMMFIVQGIFLMLFSLAISRAKSVAK